jgi:uncharacterized membrane protein
MKLLLPFPHPSLHPLARLRAWHRMVAASLTGTLVAVLTQSTLWETWLLAGWLAGSMVYLVVVWWGMGQLDATQTRLRASILDPGSTALYFMIITIAWVSLMGVLLVTDSVKSQVGLLRWLHIALALATLATSWLLIQTVFALRYARRYYMENARGLIFPGEAEPTYLDFAYFSAVIGMTSQVADVGIAHSTMRRLVLLHGLVSFGFNLMVLALTLNLIASAL